MRALGKKIQLWACLGGVSTPITKTALSIAVIPTEAKAKPSVVEEPFVLTRILW